MVTGDLDKEMEVEELFRQAYPRDEEPVNNLAINNAIWLGQFEKAIQLGNQAIRMNPRSAGGYGAITWGYLALNRPDEAKAILEPALKTNPDHSGINNSLFVVYSVLGDEKGAQRHLQWASGKVAAVGTIAGGAAGQAARFGKMRQARELSNRGIDLLVANNFNDSASSFLSFLALTEAEMGNSAAARKGIASSLALSHSRSNLPTLAVALALIGESAQARSLIDELKRRYPSDFQVNTTVGPVAMAVLQSAQGNSPAAIQTLTTASRAELGVAWGFLPIYVRGLVYLRNRQGKEAAAEFERILQYRDLAISNPHFPLSYVGLARAYALSGDFAKARAAYQDFLGLWKDADPDIPILKQAKAEYAKLQ
jgi:tetratricopeptide (TPR) repeat protein